MKLIKQSNGLGFIFPDKKKGIQYHNDYFCAVKKAGVFRNI